MRTITVQYQAGATNEWGDSRSGVVEEWATNSRNGGIFTRKSDGTWQQHTGTCQTPWFRNADHLRTYLRKHYNVTAARVIDRNGW